MGKAKGYISEYPKRVFFILGNEFCERFSFYGMKAILVIYLTRQLDFSEKDATTIYHAFNMVCYFTPLFGAMLADGLLGKYWVILSISVVYALGNAVMALTSFNPDRAGAFSALALIAIGTGGIKPCVAAFGGDQFSKDQTKQQQQFFAVFYMSINMGSLISMILTPILRTVKCGGKDCYPLAFGVPAVLMVVALIFFVIGTPWYTRVPPIGNVIGRMFGTIGTAISNKCGSKEKKEHWLDHAYPKYSKDFIFEVKSILRVLLMFVPLPVFWALFDQQGSRWTLQAGKMNGKIGNFRLLPDQLGAINPLLVIVLVPIIESLIYPCLGKLRIPNRPLQRMGAGMVLAALAFVVSGLLQITIDNSQPKAVPKMKSQIRFFNGASCPVNITVQPNVEKIVSSMATPFYEVKSDSYNATMMAECHKGSAVVLPVTLNSTKRYRVLIAEYKGKPVANLFLHTLDSRPIKGKSGISFLNAINETLFLKLKGTAGQAEQIFENIASLGQGDFKQMQAGDYDVFLGINKTHFDKKRSGRVNTEMGGVYTVILLRDTKDNTTVSLRQHQDISPNVVHMLWQLPQYFIMTVGECLFSVTGLGFAYSQSPSSMKAICQAAWNLTNAFGNLIVIIVAQAGNITNRAVEFFFFAGLMAVTVVIFTIMALFYKYVDFTDIEKQRREKEEAEKEETEMSNGTLPEKSGIYIPEKVPGIPGYVPAMRANKIATLDMPPPYTPAEGTANLAFVGESTAL